MKPIKTQIEELERGCGEVFQLYGITECGEKHGVIILYCETCKAKLQTLKECKKMFDDYNEKLKLDLSSWEKCTMYAKPTKRVFDVIDKLSKEVLGEQK